MSQLIKQQQVVADHWLVLADEAELPETGAVLVSWARWQAQREALLARGGELGVQLPNTVEPSVLAADVAKLSLIALEFPKFADGRAYSQARLLRERYAYHGELRAVGEVLRDQLFYMARCGFDAFQLARGDAHAALQALQTFSVRYQPAADEPLPLYRRR